MVNKIRVQKVKRGNRDVPQLLVDGLPVAQHFEKAFQEAFETRAQWRHREEVSVDWSSLRQALTAAGEYPIFGALLSLGTKDGTFICPEDIGVGPVRVRIEGDLAIWMLTVSDYANEGTGAFTLTFHIPQALKELEQSS